MKSCPTCADCWRASPPYGRTILPSDKIASRPHAGLPSGRTPVGEKLACAVRVMARLVREPQVLEQPLGAHCGPYRRSLAALVAIFRQRLELYRLSAAAWHFITAAAGPDDPVACLPATTTPPQALAPAAALHALVVALRALAPPGMAGAALLVAAAGGLGADDVAICEGAAVRMANRAGSAGDGGASGGPGGPLPGGRRRQPGGGGHGGSAAGPDAGGGGTSFAMPLVAQLPLRRAAAEAQLTPGPAAP